MSRIALVLIVGCVASMLCTGNNKKLTEAENMGLRGPVHTQTLETRMLNEDPRTAPKLFIWSPFAWTPPRTK